MQGLQKGTHQAYIRIHIELPEMRPLKAPSYLGALCKKLVQAETEAIPQKNFRSRPKSARTLETQAQVSKTSGNVVG